MCLLVCSAVAKAGAAIGRAMRRGPRHCMGCPSLGRQSPEALNAAWGKTTTTIYIYILTATRRLFYFFFLHCFSLSFSSLPSFEAGIACTVLASVAVSPWVLADILHMWVLYFGIVFECLYDHVFCVYYGYESQDQKTKLSIYLFRSPHFRGTRLSSTTSCVVIVKADDAESNALLFA